jgi:23S rRNA pseudouridine1911/1915/1917 synthase
MAARQDPPALLRILHVDEHIIAINKPPGLLAAPGRGDTVDAPTLLRNTPELSDNPAVRIVHRIDRDASGVLLYARTLAAQRSLVAQFTRRQVRKTYLAIVSGYVLDDGEIDRNLTFDRRRQRVRVVTARGRRAITRYRILERLAGNTAVECEPLTGRTHQIRVHMAWAGHPLTVDPLYGGGRNVLLSFYKPDYRPSKRREERPLIERLTLHARRIELNHPVTGERFTVEADVPKDMTATIRQLARLV